MTHYAIFAGYSALIVDADESWCAYLDGVTGRNLLESEQSFVGLLTVIGSQSARNIKFALEEAWRINLGISRTPYFKYLDEVKRDGLAKVNIHGIGIFSRGKPPSFQAVRAHVYVGRSRKHVYDVYEEADLNAVLLSDPKAKRLPIDKFDVVAAETAVYLAIDVKQTLSSKQVHLAT